MAVYSIPAAGIILNPRISTPERVGDRVRLADPTVQPPDRLLTFLWNYRTTTGTLATQATGPGDYLATAANSHDLTDDYVYRIVDARIAAYKGSATGFNKGYRLLDGTFLQVLEGDTDQVEVVDMILSNEGNRSGSNVRYFKSYGAVQTHTPNLFRGSVLVPRFFSMLCPDASISAAGGGEAVFAFDAEVKFVGWPSSERKSGALWLPELYR